MGVRIELTDANSEKLEKARSELDMSTNALVNMIVEAVDFVEIQSIVRVKMKHDGDVQGTVGRRKFIVKRVSGGFKF